MIDIHFHCLPAIDDGPPDWDAAVALCRAAAEQGIETIVATPHVLRDSWINADEGSRDAQIAKLNGLLGGRPTILPGCEFWFSTDLLEFLDQKVSPVTRLNRGSYLLVEFPPGFVPKTAESVFHELSILGITPVVAHPERNRVFSAEPERLAALVDRGAVTQVTAGSLLGEFGKLAQAACETFFEGGLVHVIASDAHDLKHRPPRLAAARERVRKAWGNEAEQGLFDANPAAILASQPLPFRAG